MSEDLILKRGERGVIIGQTGSGKTQMLLAQIRAHSNSPIYILDTKCDDSIAHFLKDEQPENFEKIHSLEALEKFTRNKKTVDFCWIIPPPIELSDPYQLDQYLYTIYAANKSCLVCIDEVYTFHKHTNSGPGLNALLTRGRSKGMSLLCCTQRPAFTTQFIYTESDKFFIYYLLEQENINLRKKGLPFPKIKLDKYRFWYYKSSEYEGSIYPPLKLFYNAGYTNDNDSYSEREWF